MEPDPLPWLIFALTLLFVGLATALEVIVTVFTRSEIRRKFVQSDSLTQLLTELLEDIPVLFVTLGLLKNMGLMLLGAASLWLALQVQSMQVLVGLLGSWLLLALLQPIWRGLILQNAETLVFHLAPLLRVFMVLLRPVTFSIHQINNWANQHESMRVEDGAGLTDEALRMLMTTTDSAEEIEEIEENEREMIASILEMNDTVVREVMVPRIDMVAMDADTTFHEALDTIISAGHSRIPVYEEHIDRIIGILYAKDILRCFRDQTTDTPLRQLLRPPYFIPASKKVDALFQEMQKHRVHIATVVDEYGGTAGLVTIEDIIEEIMGDIQDEYDAEEDIYVQLIGPDTYLLNSRLDVYSLSKLLDIELDSDSADTLGGLLFNLMEHVPEQGECVEHQGWRLTVLSLDGRRIEQVRTERVPAPRQDGMVNHGKSAREQLSSSDLLSNLQAMD